MLLLADAGAIAKTSVQMCKLFVPEVNEHEMK